MRITLWFGWYWSVTASSVLNLWEGRNWWLAMNVVALSFMAITHISEYLSRKEVERERIAGVFE